MTGSAAFGGALVALLALQLPGGAPPDTAPPPPAVAAGVLPDTVTVGDRFRSFLRVTLPAGARLDLPTVTADDSLEVVDSATLRVADGVHTAVFPMAAWIAGEPLRKVVELRVTGADGDSRSYHVALRLPVVRSVLPAGEELQPRPPKGLLLADPGARSWWWILALLALAAGLAVAVALFARGRAARPTSAATADPRAEALARLDRLGAGGRAPMAPDAYYAEITRALREYLSRLDPRWGEDLTTAELLARRAPADPIDWKGMAALLEAADPVKFGAVSPAPAIHPAFWSAARRWVEVNPEAPAGRREAA